MEKAGYTRFMRLVMGFRESKIILVANELDLFSRMAKEDCSIEGLAAQLKVNERALGIIINALVAMGILLKRGVLYGNQEIARKYLVKESPDYLGHFLSFLNYCCNELNCLEETLTQYRPGECRPSLATRDAGRFERIYIRAMDNIARERAERIARHLDLEKTVKMLDLGCGAATYAIAFALVNSQLTAVALDLPAPLDIAAENIRMNCLDHRIHLLEGSYWEVDYGSGYDLVWISQIIHSLDEFRVKELFRKAVNALAPGGRLIIHDSLLGEDGISPYHAALFSVFMLALTEGGRCHTVKDTRSWLLQAGLQDITHYTLDAESDLVIGIKPI
jgi:ubiquinone/menaquinone biosynthesis C-methylase UbiE